MSEEDFIKQLKQKLSEFERRNGRVPSIGELAKELGVHTRWLRSRLRKAIATIGSDAQIEGTSAFKSSLRQLLSPSLLSSGSAGYSELEALMEEASSSLGRWVELRWPAGHDDAQYLLAVRYDGRLAEPTWSLSIEEGAHVSIVWQYATKDMYLIASLLENCCGNAPSFSKVDESIEQRDNVLPINIKKFEEPEDAPEPQTQTEPSGPGGGGRRPRTAVGAGGRGGEDPHRLPLSLPDIPGLYHEKSGSFTHQAILFFLNQHYGFYEQFEFPFSLIVFSFGYRRSESGPVQAAARETIKLVLERIKAIARNVDLVGHFESFDFAVILPNATSIEASQLASLIKSDLIESPITDRSQKLVMAFGIASIPEHRKDVGKMTSLAKSSNRLSKRTGSIVVANKENSG